MGANNINLYWPVYHNLEKEVLSLANDIHFCDEQLDVFSIKIADLLFRASAELESIIKNLYRIEKDTEPKTPGDALIELNNLWALDRKTVTMSASNMYFTSENHRVFAPFEYADKDENDYYSAYNAVKHDRVKNITKANIRVLLRLMASLYLLNIYYKNKEFGVKDDNEIYQFDASLGSQLFSIAVDGTYKINTQISGNVGNDISRCVYIATYNERQIENILANVKSYNKQAIQIVQNENVGIDFEKECAPALTNPHLISTLGRLAGEIVLAKKLRGIVDREEQVNFLKNSDEYNLYIKHNPRTSINFEGDVNNIIKTIAFGWYYKNLMDLASAAMSPIWHTSSKLVLNKNQSKCR